METAIANRGLVDDLVKNGKLFPADLAPPGYKPVNLEFSQKGYYATPRLAQMLNGLFNDSNSKSFWDHAVGVVGKTSTAVQKMELTTGIPRTDINLHTIGQIIKEVTAGNFKEIIPFIRANSDKTSAQFFEDNRDVLVRMAKQGLDVGRTVADYLRFRLRALQITPHNFKAFKHDESRSAIPPDLPADQGPRLAGEDRPGEADLGWPLRAGLQELPAHEEEGPLACA
jgi:hypothetical protein